MIVTVTLNPAIDKTCFVERLTIGSINRMQKVEQIAGGKGVNVTKILRQFGYPVKAMGFLAGSGGAFIEKTLSKMGAECDFTYVEGETRTSTNIIDADETVTEVLEPGFTVSQEEVEQFVSTFEERGEGAEIVVFSGSIPCGVPSDIYKRLIRMAKEKGCKTFLDTSGEALSEGLAAVPYFVKPNAKELVDYVGIVLNGKEDMAYQATKLCEKGIGKVVVTLGAQGLVAVTPSDVIYHDVYPVKVTNTVGCGDTVVASYVMSELSGDDGKEAAKKASALAAANAATMENGNISKETYEKLLNS